MSWHWLFWVISAIGSITGSDAHAGTISKQPLQHPPVITATNQVDINHADFATLAKVPGLGAKQAELLVNYRQEHGAFHNVNDLILVKGISKRRVNKIISENPNIVAKP